MLMLDAWCLMIEEDSKRDSTTMSEDLRKTQGQAPVYKKPKEGYQSRDSHLGGSDGKARLIEQINNKFILPFFIVQVDKAFD